MQFFSIHLPVKGYIKKYLQQKYGCPLTLSANDVFSDVFTAMLLVPLPVRSPRCQLDQQLNRLDHKLSVKMPIDLLYRMPSEPNQHSTYRLNKYFENMFREEFCENVDRLVQFAALERQVAIEHMATRYHLEIDVDTTLDALKKMEYRYRKEKEEKARKFLAYLSSTNGLFQ